MTRPTRRSPSLRCSSPRRCANPSAGRFRLLLAMVSHLQSLCGGRAKGRERVRPNVRSFSRQATTPRIEPRCDANTAEAAGRASMSCRGGSFRRLAAVASDSTAREVRAPIHRVGDRPPTSSRHPLGAGHLEWARRAAEEVRDVRVGDGGKDPGRARRRAGRGHVGRRADCLGERSGEYKAVAD